jgi:hypothetical protein
VTGDAGFSSENQRMRRKNSAFADPRILPALARQRRAMQNPSMTRIPTPALILGLAGLIPFIYGALSLVLPGIAWLGEAWSVNHTGRALLHIYGIVILCFMAGVIWGFAAKADGQTAALYYTLSVIPAIFVFLTAFAEPRASLTMLMIGFVALLAIDARATRQGLAPPWWMRLRLLLTSVVVLCLGIGVLS